MQLYVIFFVCVFSTAYCQKASYRFCVYPSDHLKCADLDKGGSNVQCVKVQDSVDCALKIQKGEADFGTFYPEQAHLVSSFIEEETAVVGELRVKNRQDRNNSFQFVVVVKDGYSGGIQGLRGKNLCHPGFKDRQLWTSRVRKELEYELFKENPIKCSETDDTTCIETEIATLAQFFGDSCRPGPWVLGNPELDLQLQKKYSKLCKLCEDPETCSYMDTDLEDNVTYCLIEKDADYMYTSLESVINHYNETERLKFKLLCKDGSLGPVGNFIPDQCSWRNQPWSIILARKEKAEQISRDLKTWIAPELQVQGKQPFSGIGRKTDVWIPTLQNILTRNEADHLQLYYNKKSPNDFFEQKNQKVALLKLIDATMKWCTVSEEEEHKCEWLRQASKIAGIEPEMECVLGRNEYDCLNKIKNKSADVMSIDSRLGYLARKKGLHNLLFNDKSESDVSSIIALLPQTSSVMNLKNLKGKKACFPEYRGLAWVSFVETARKQNIISQTCDYGESVSEFFSEACAPGAAGAYHNRTDGTNLTKICGLCQDNCYASEENKYFNDFGAFNCLKDNNADVAFVKKQALDSLQPANIGNYKVLCKDDTVKEFNQIRDMDSCALFETVDSEVISRLNDPRTQDYKLAVLHMENLFGTAFKNEKTMEMFKQFNGIDNLMFKSTVLGFEDDSSSNSYVQNYKKLFKNVDTCFKPLDIVTTSSTPTNANEKPNTAWAIASSVTALLLSISFILLFTLNY